MRVILPAGCDKTSFKISIKKDNIEEDNETFNITIVHDSLPYYITLGNRSTANVTIIDSKYINFNFICT